MCDVFPYVGVHLPLCGCIEAGGGHQVTSSIALLGLSLSLELIHLAGQSGQHFIPSRLSSPDSAPQNEGGTL